MPGKTPSLPGGRGDVLVTLMLQQEFTRLIVVTVMIYITGIIAYLQLTDVNRNKVKQNENVHWRILSYS